MSSQKINEYYDATTNRAPREDLVQAVQLTTTNGVAVDCGCGAGSDIAHLREHGFKVHAFDIEQGAIDRCQALYGDDPQVVLTRASFLGFEYPPADLIVADASLFFCPPADFPVVWQKMTHALNSGGVFVGALLGVRDTMATDQYDSESFWPEVSLFTESQLRTYFDGFELHKFYEYEVDGKTAQGEDHHWHMFQVIAIKDRG